MLFKSVLSRVALAILAVALTASVAVGQVILSVESPATVYSVTATLRGQVVCSGQTQVQFQYWPTGSPAQMGRSPVLPVDCTQGTAKYRIPGELSPATDYSARLVGVQGSTPSNPTNFRTLPDKAPLIFSLTGTSTVDLTTGADLVEVVPGGLIGLNGANLDNVQCLFNHSVSMPAAQQVEVNGIKIPSHPSPNQAFCLVPEGQWPTTPIQFEVVAGSGIESDQVRGMKVSVRMVPGVNVWRIFNSAGEVVGFPPESRTLAIDNDGFARFSLFGTGFRSGTGAPLVSVGGQSAEVVWVGPSDPGIDRIDAKVRLSPGFVLGKVVIGDRNASFSFGAVMASN